MVDLPKADPKILLWDIETSFYVHTSWTKWTPGMKIVKEKSVICIAYKWLGQEETHVISIGDFPAKFKKDPFDDSKVIEEFKKVIDSANLAIAHNGDKFDMKFFNSRLLKHGLNPIMVKTFDTLKAAKYYFSFHSNRLGDIADFLGVNKKTRTDISWWNSILFDRDWDSLNLMQDYCKQDVLVLEDVYKKMLPYIKGNHPHINLLKYGGDIPKDVLNATCPRCGSDEHIKWGIYTAISNSYQKYKCKSCNHVFRGNSPIKV